MTTQVPFTAEHLQRMPEDGFRYELWKGELRRMTPAGLRHGVVVGNVFFVLREYQNVHSGLVLTGDTGFRLSKQPETVLAPDVAYISGERTKEGVPVGYFDGAPDLAVEVVSPGNTAEELERKAGAFLAAGSLLVWIVNPESRRVVIHPDREVLKADGILDGGNVLPGFSCPVDQLFEGL